MIIADVLELMRRVFSERVLLDVHQLEQLQKLLEAHEQQIRERCALIAEQHIHDSGEAHDVAQAILNNRL